MKMKISSSKIKEFEETFGKFEICRSEGKNARTYLRFGYWRKVNFEVLKSLLPLFDVYEESDYDEDCGWKYSYTIISKIKIEE
jgi:hypothetical protein